MANYIVEMGIDLVAAPYVDGTFPSLVSLVNRTDAESPKPAWFTNFQPGDTMVVRVFDYRKDGRFHLKGAFVRFLETSEPSLASGLVSPSTKVVGVFEIVPDAQSNVRPGAPGYMLTEDGVEVHFTVNDVEAKTAVLKLEAYATVDKGESTQVRVFVDDPEIFIGEG